MVEVEMEIGGRFWNDGRFYETVDSGAERCTGCNIDYRTLYGGDLCDSLVCYSTLRHDNRNVIYKEVKEND